MPSRGWRARSTSLSTLSSTMPGEESLTRRSGHASARVGQLCETLMRTIEFGQLFVYRRDGPFTVMTPFARMLCAGCSLIVECNHLDSWLVSSS